MNALGFVIFTCKRLDLTDAGEIIVQRGIQVPQLLLPVTEGGTNISGIYAQGNDHQGNGNDAQQGQLPVDVNQHRRHRDKRDDVDDHIRQGMGNQLLEQVRIVDHVGHELPHLLVLIISQGQPLHMLINVLAHIRHHAPAGHMRHVGAQELQQSPGNVDCQGNDRQLIDQLHRIGRKIGLCNRPDQSFYDPWDQAAVRRPAPACSMR